MFVEYLINKLKEKIKLSKTLKTRKYYIELPFNHNLTNYIKDYPKYDKVILEIVGNLENNSSSVIDVGANCGDTIIPMYFKNKLIKYFGIEPDSFFFNFLKKNILQNNLKDKINIYSNFITSRKKSGILKGKYGTKNFVSDRLNAISNQISLDEFVNQNKIKNIKLIKIDTDGYDYDVIQSGIKTISKYRPVIFFECQIENKKNLKNYNQILNILKKSGYSNFLFFDNYGNYLLETAINKHFQELLQYIYKQANQKNKSIYYFDIFACSKKDYKRFLNLKKL